MNNLARRKTIRESDETGSFSGYSSRRASLRPASITTGVKRKPVPSMYPYSPANNFASCSSTTFTTFSQLLPPLPAKSSFSEEGQESFVVSSTFEPSRSHQSSPEASSLEDVNIDDDTESSSIKSSPLTSSPEICTSDLCASETLSPAAPTIEKDEAAPIDKELRHVASSQPSINGVDVYLYGVDVYLENVLAFEARNDMLYHTRTIVQVEERAVSLVVA
jgi:hypothetical protein